MGTDQGDSGQGACLGFEQGLDLLMQAFSRGFIKTAGARRWTRHEGHSRGAFGDEIRDETGVLTPFLVILPFPVRQDPKS